MISLPIKWDIQIILKFQDKLIPRKLDAQILNVLSSIAQSAFKFSNDIRLYNI